MRLGLAVAVLVASLSSGAAFAPVQPRGFRPSICTFSSTVEADTTENTAETAAVSDTQEETAPSRAALSGADINSLVEKNLKKLRAKDSSSPQLSKEVSDDS